MQLITRIIRTVQTGLQSGMNSNMPFYLHIISVYFFALFMVHPVFAQKQPVKPGSVVPVKYPKPSIPEKPLATDNKYMSKIRVSWKSVDGATQYRIYRCKTVSKNTCNRGILDKQSPYDDQAVIPGRTYYYRIKACNKLRCSDYSQPDAGSKRVVPVPVVPRSPSVSLNIYTAKVKVSWNHSPGTASYKVFRCDNATSTNCGAGFPVQGSPYLDTTAVPGRAYFYRIQACNAQGCSGLSSPAKGGIRLRIPGGLKASFNEYTNMIKVSWSRVQGEARYTLFKCFKPESSRTSAKVCVPKLISGTMLNDVNVQPGKYYYFSVKACGDVGCSLKTQVVYGMRKLMPPGQVSASDNIELNRVTVSWQRQNHADFYRVFRCLNATAGNTCTQLVTLANKLGFSDTTAIPGKQYYYRVRACVQAGCSDLSAADAGKRKLKLHSIRFQVPLNVSGIHIGIKEVIPLCRVFNSNIMSNSNEVANGSLKILVNNSRKVQQSVNLTISDNIHPGKQFENSTHYSCTLYVSKKNKPGLFVYSTTTSDIMLKALVPPVNVVNGLIDINSAVPEGNVVAGKMTVKVNTARLKATGMN